MFEANFLKPNRLVFLADTAKQAPEGGEAAKKDPLATMSAKEVKEVIAFAKKEAAKLRQFHKKLDPKLRESEGHKQTLRELEGVDKLIRGLKENKNMHLNAQREHVVFMVSAILRLINKTPDQVFEKELNVATLHSVVDWEGKETGAKKMTPSIEDRPEKKSEKPDIIPWQ